MAFINLTSKHRSKLDSDDETLVPWQIRKGEGRKQECQCSIARGLTIADKR